MSMRRAMGTVLISVLAVAVSVAPGVWAQGVGRTAIVGFDQYVLGAAQSVILAADTELAPGNWPLWTTRVSTVRFGKRITAPIGGFNYRAELGLEFLNNTLVVVAIYWPSQAFDTASEWRARTRDLYAQLMATYDASLIVTNFAPSDRSGGLIELRDAGGNRLHMISGSDRFNIFLVYRSAEHVRAVDASPEPKGKY